MATFEFRFDPRFALPLAALGVLPRTTSVTVSETVLVVRFGLWRLRTGLDNVAGVERSGPYRAYRAIGPRLSFTDHGVTFGTNTRAGLCVKFHRPVPALEPSGRLRHPGMTVTVEDLEGLAGALG
ncbi:MAG TPA: hypothetical protein VNG13_13910 [Mycobacteriales bacterium]|nr:hypothetical protein [Mycobacteriales bacterium]